MLEFSSSKLSLARYSNYPQIQAALDDVGAAIQEFGV
jgi:hypothetical protein